MQNIVGKSALLGFLFFVTVNLHSTQSEAAIAVQTQIASGYIKQIFNNNSIKLDNDQTYQASRKNLAINAEAGDPITLRYVVESDGINVFFESAPGLHSLKNTPLPISKKNNSKK